MTSNVRRALFHVLMLSTIETDNTVLIDNGEEVRESLLAIKQLDNLYLQQLFIQ